MMTDWKLSPLDLFALGMNIKGAWIYNEAPDADKMRRALAEIASTYPYLTGRYKKSRKSVVWDRNSEEELPFVVSTNSSVSTSELIGNPDKTWSLVKPYNLNAFKEGRISPFSAQLVNLKDGAVLFIQCCHGTMDGNSFYTLAQQWAALTKGEEIVPMIVDQSVLPSEDAMDKEEAMQAVIEGEWVKMTPGKIIGMLWHMARAKAAKKTYIIEVSQEEISRIKTESGAGTHAVLCAISAKAMMEKMNPHPFKVITVADLRGHFSGIPTNFMGNLSQPFVTKAEFNPFQSTGQLAMSIQKAIVPILNSDELEKNTRLSLCASHHGLPYFYFDATDMGKPKPANIYFNNQLKFRACELDFGSGLPLYAFPNDLTDMVKFWQPVKGGPVQIIFWGNVAKLMSQARG